MSQTELLSVGTSDAIPEDVYTPDEADLIARIKDVNRRLEALSPDVSAWVRIAGPRALRAIAQTVPPGKLFSVVLQLTPKHGDVFVNYRKGNRREREGAVRALRRDQENFNWELGGQGLSFEAVTGQLSNGNHRSLALQGAKEGTLIHQLCVFGVEEDNAVDTGLARTLGDALSRGGMPNGIRTAAIALRMQAIDANPPQPVNPGTTRKASRLELLSYVENHPEVADAARHTYKVHGIPEYVPGAAAGEILILLRRAASCLPTGDTAWADQFYSSWAGMVSVEEGNPIHALRKKLASRGTLKDPDATRRERHAAPGIDEVVALAMLAWNKWQLNQHVSRLQLAREGVLTSKNFPWPTGYREWASANGITLPKPNPAS